MTCHALSGTARVFPVAASSNMPYHVTKREASSPQHRNTSHGIIPPCICFQSACYSESGCLRPWRTHFCLLRFPGRAPAGSSPPDTPCSPPRHVCRHLGVDPSVFLDSAIRFVAYGSGASRRTPWNLAAERTCLPTPTGTPSQAWHPPAGLPVQT